MRPVFLVCALLSLVSFGQGQVSSPKLPCEFQGKLLRSSQGEIGRFTSDEMKKRATHKVDLDGFIRQLDFRSTVFVGVLVDVSGEVVCTNARNPVGSEAG